MLAWSRTGLCGLRIWHYGGSGSQLQLRLDPWPGNFCMLHCGAAVNEKKKPKYHDLKNRTINTLLWLEAMRLGEVYFPSIVKPITKSKFKNPTVEDLRFLKTWTIFSHNTLKKSEKWYNMNELNTFSFLNICFKAYILIILWNEYHYWNGTYIHRGPQSPRVHLQLLPPPGSHWSAFCPLQISLNFIEF